MIGRIISVDTQNRTATIMAYGPEDDFIISGAHIDSPFPTGTALPMPGDMVKVSQDDREWFIRAYVDQDNEEHNSDMSNEHLAPGDTIIGSRGNGIIGWYRGGMLVFLANSATGIMASDTDGTINILGKNIVLHNAAYTNSIKSDNGSCIIEEKAAGLAGLKTTDKKVNLLTGNMEYNLSGIAQIKVNINNKITDISGPDLDVTIKVPVGEVKLTINPVTGNVDIKTPGELKIEAKHVLLNTDGLDPLDGVVTGKSICPYTLGPHTDCSKTVLSSK